jgi:hypothetical protein
MAVETEIVEEIIVLEFTMQAKPAPHAKIYWVHINGEKVKIETPHPTGDVLLKAANKQPCAFELIAEFIHHESEVVEPSESVDLRQHGLKGFITAHKEVVTIFIGGKPYTIERGERPVAEILLKAGLTSAGYDLYDDKTGLPLPAGQAVNIHGCEEFIAQVRGGASS